jgi:hypothetical protein
MNTTNQKSLPLRLRAKATASLVGLLRGLVRGLLPEVDGYTPAGPLSLRAYARHRGVSAPTVLRAIRRGSLKASLVRDVDGHAKIADVALADSEWPIPATSPGLSLRAYARHRGVSAPAVLRAIRRGSLKASLVRDAEGHTRIADVALADSEWPARPRRELAAR